MSDPSLEKRDDGGERLQSELAGAIERARQRTASPAMVENLTARVLEITARPISEVRQNGSPASRNARLYWLCVVAAPIGLILSLRSWLTVPVNRSGDATVELLTQPVYSRITTVSFTRVGYRQIEEDLDRADAQVEEASEGLALTSVRHEIQETLDEFYDWSK